MHIGMRSTSVAMASLDKAFAAVSRIGADGIEVSYQAADEVGNWPDHAKTLRALSKQHHLAIPSLNLAFMAETPSLVQPGELSTRAKHAVLGALTVASAIGAGVVLVPFMGKNSIEVEKEMKNAAANLANLAETAEEAGVVLGIESTLNFDQQQFLLDQLGNSPCAKIYYDTGDALVRKFDVATGIRDLGAERIAQVHLKDARIAEGKAPDYNVNLGEGDLDYRAVANALRAIGFDGWIILETPPGSDAIANGKKNLQFARNLFGPEIPSADN